MDKNFLLHALNLAKKNLGATSPNPSVGCVIVKNGRILTTGATFEGGRPHAERVAIEKIADKSLLEGATLYVSLEPCCHTGLTAPCTDLIIDSGVSRVVIAAMDIDPRVNGLGVKKLSEAGLQVDVIELDEAYELNKAFFKAKASALPYVTLKLATSLDGKIACRSLDSKWITGERARRFSHQLRAVNDAILVGANTFRCDEPSLDCRIKGLEDRSPAPFILGNGESERKNVKFLTFEDRGGENRILCAKNGDFVDLEDALKKICELGHNSVLVEGGAKLATGMLRADLVDELIWIQSSKIIGNDGLAAVQDLGFDRVDEILSDFRRSEIFDLGDTDFAGIYRRFQTINSKYP